MIDIVSPYEEFAVKTPYPEVKITQPNPVYGQMMLDNMGGSVSEMSAVALYFYSQLMTEKEPVVAQTFHQISITEMRHLAIFGEYAKLQGESPRLWTQTNNGRYYWTPGYLNYFYDLKDILRNALTGEENAIRKYQSQLDMITDPYMIDSLQRIIADEESHVKMFKWLIYKYA
ncbi:MAG: rubrerythrin family protein [Peptococcaceae bacterium]|nr:rubrerythrin family protein [Peptococcaceae bacterium]